jgi:hypothetical protein
MQKAVRSGKTMYFRWSGTAVAAPLYFFSVPAIKYCRSGFYAIL